MKQADTALDNQLPNQEQSVSFPALSLITIIKCTYTIIVAPNKGSIKSIYFTEFYQITIQTCNLWKNLCKTPINIYYKFDVVHKIHVHIFDVIAKQRIERYIYSSQIKQPNTKHPLQTNRPFRRFIHFLMCEVTFDSHKPKTPYLPLLSSHFESPTSSPISIIIIIN